MSYDLTWLIAEYQLQNYSGQFCRTKYNPLEQDGQQNIEISDYRKVYTSRC